MKRGRDDLAPRKRSFLIQKKFEREREVTERERERSFFVFQNERTLLIRLKNVLANMF